MRVNWKLVAAAAGGIGWGSAMTWAVMADKYDNIIKLQNEMITFLKMERPIGHVTNVYHNSDGLEVSGVLFSPEGEADETNVTEEAAEEPLFTDEEIEEARGNLQDIIDKYTGDPDTVEQFVERSLGAIQNPKPPYVISRAQYAYDEDYDDFDKETLTYLPRFRVLLDDDGELAGDPGDLVNWRCLTRFGDQSEERDTVFVRNERMKTDFEVVRDEERELPLHVKYGMERGEFAAARAAGIVRLRDEDRD